MIPDTDWEEEKDKNPEQIEKFLNEHFPLGRMVTPNEVTNVIVFML